MLVGCFIRGYKVYDKTVFIPLVGPGEVPFTGLIGVNGAGKSSVLEALDVFFNGRDWNFNASLARDEAFVAPVFLVAKEEFSGGHELSELSNYFWGVDEGFNYGAAKSSGIKDFFDFKKSLKEVYSSDDYYLLVMAANDSKDMDDLYFGSFDSSVNTYLKDKNLDRSLLRDALIQLFCSYTYVYVPVETLIDELLRLESFELQDLMDKDIKHEIDKILTERVEISDETGVSKVSVMNYINRKLHGFVDSVNTAIKDVDQAYSFSGEKNYKKNVTPQDIRDRIIDEYFSVRGLKKAGKPVSKLSSGEQRVALLDIVYAMLKSGRAEGSVIVAIDEPETSLHVSRCYGAFRRLRELAIENRSQIIVSSHWYGFLPIVDGGNLVHVSDWRLDGSFGFSLLSLAGPAMGKKGLPDDINLKSFFDLVSALIGAMRTESCNWIICEGIDDKAYLKRLFSDDVRIIPVAGCGNVLKVFNYLSVALRDRAEQAAVKGKILCLVDTDPQPLVVDGSSDVGGVLYIRRLNLRDGNLELVRMGSAIRRDNTCYEDLLDPKAFFGAVKEVACQLKDNETLDFLNKVDLPDGDGTTYFTEGIEKAFGYLTREMHSLVPRVKELIKKHDAKYLIAQRYTEAGVVARLELRLKELIYETWGIALRED